MSSSSSSKEAAVSEAILTLASTLLDKDKDNTTDTSTCVDACADAINKCEELLLQSNVKDPLSDDIGIAQDALANMVLPGTSTILLIH